MGNNNNPRALNTHINLKSKLLKKKKWTFIINFWFYPIEAELLTSFPITNIQGITICTNPALIIYFLDCSVTGSYFL